MNKVFLLTGLFFLFFVSESGAQHFIGLDKNETRQLAKKSGYYPDNITTSQVFNYLKFVNSSDTKTLIVFFSDEDISTSFKIVCDYSEYDFITKEYNKIYKKTGKNHWEYKKGNDTFEVFLDEQDWYFVLRIKKK